MTNMQSAAVKAVSSMRAIRMNIILWSVWFAAVITWGALLFGNIKGAAGGVIVGLGPFMFVRLWMRDRFVARRMLAMCVVGLVGLLIILTVLPAHLADLWRRP